MNARLKLYLINALTGVMLAIILETMIYAGLENPGSIPRFMLGLFQDYHRQLDRNIIQITDCARYDSLLFYRLKPGRCSFTNREFNTSYEINSQGLRDDERSLSNPRIIALGDSYTMGWGVRQDESFPQLVENEIGGTVLNAGISSFGTAREMRLLKRLQRDSLRVIILQYHGNDFTENAAFIKSGFSLNIRSKSSYDSLRSEIEARRRYFPLKHLYGMSKTFAKKMLFRWAAPVTETGEAQAFLEVVRNANIDPSIRILVFKVDDYQQLTNDFAREVDSLLTTPGFRSMNIETIKLAPSLKKEDYFILDDHIGKSGHAKIAAKITSQIVSVSP